MGVDENTRKKNSLDVARTLIRTNSYNVFNMELHAMVNGSRFHIKVLEKWCGPMRWDGLSQVKTSGGSDYNSNSEDGSEDGDGPLLFRNEVVEDDDSGDDGEDEKHEGTGEEEEDDKVGLQEGKIVIHEPANNNYETAREMNIINRIYGDINEENGMNGIDGIELLGKPTLVERKKCNESEEFAAPTLGGFNGNLCKLPLHPIVAGQPKLKKLANIKRHLTTM